MNSNFNSQQEVWEYLLVPENKIIDQQSTIYQFKDGFIIAHFSSGVVSKSANSFNAPNLFQKKEKIYLGIGKSGFVQDEPIYLQKHSWDCDWYWGFGYIGNNNLHCHFEKQFLTKETSISELLDNPQYSQDSWWVIRDLFIQAYALKACAEVYKYGGRQTSSKGITDIIKNEEMCKGLNSDLEKVLDKLWDFLQINHITK